MSIISNLSPDVKNTVKWIAVGLLAIAVALLVWKVSSFIKDLRESQAKIQAAETNEKIAIANRDGLVAVLSKIEKNIEEIKKKNAELEKKIDDSGEKIQKIATRTKETLAALEKEELPEGCEEQFQWLLDKSLDKKDEK